MFTYKTFYNVRVTALRILHRLAAQPIASRNSIPVTLAVEETIKSMKLLLGEMYSNIDYGATFANEQSL